MLEALQSTALAYLRRDGDAIPFWRMASAPVDELRARAEAIVGTVPAATSRVTVIETNAVPGGGTLPTVTIPSMGLRMPGDRLEDLRRRDLPIIARVVDGDTVLDLRSVPPESDRELAVALAAIGDEP